MRDVRIGENEGYGEQGIMNDAGIGEIEGCRDMGE